MRAWNDWRPREARRGADGAPGKLIDVTVERWGEHEREIVVGVDRDRRVVLVRQLREPACRKLLELAAGVPE